MPTIAELLSQELGQKLEYIENVIALIDEGNTIPFIARYRKELHGSMDDTALRTLEERLQYLRNLEKRREEVKSSIESQGKLTEELSAAIAEEEETIVVAAFRSSKMGLDAFCSLVEGRQRSGVPFLMNENHNEQEDTIHEV